MEGNEIQKLVWRKDFRASAAWLSKTNAILSTERRKKVYHAELNPSNALKRKMRH